MPKPSNLSAMSVDQLLKLRSDVEQVLTRRAAQLRDDLSKLSGSKEKVGGTSLNVPSSVVLGSGSAPARPFVVFSVSSKRGQHDDHDVF
jgi:hypothetical protein